MRRLFLSWTTRYAVNVVDLCPVGAMTSADFRFKQRVWFMKKERGVCHGCAKGCNITIDHNREKDQDDLIYRFRPDGDLKDVAGMIQDMRAKLKYLEQFHEAQGASLPAQPASGLSCSTRRSPQELEEGLI